jgi:anthranilate synthase component I
MDTCIAIRTLAVKDGVAHLQAGGGIVFDSEPTPEYYETMNKMKALAKAIEAAERAVQRQASRKRPRPSAQVG